MIFLNERHSKRQIKKRMGKPRRNAAPFWRRIWFGGFLSVAIIIFGAGSGWWIFSSGWLDERINRIMWSGISILSKSGFKLSEILVVGRFYTSQKDLRRAMRLERGSPILTYDLKAARKRVEALPWIRHVSVERMLPDKILLFIEESQALAIWQNNGKFSLIDKEGKIIKGVNLNQFQDLMVVIGKHAPNNTAELFALLETQPSLKKLIKTAIWVGGRRWNLRMEGEIDIRLPEKNVADALARLVDYERAHQILGEDIKALDLRIPDRLIISKKTPKKNQILRNGQET